MLFGNSILNTPDRFWKSIINQQVKFHVTVSRHGVLQRTHLQPVAKPCTGSFESLLPELLALVQYQASLQLAIHQHPYLVPHEQHATTMRYHLAESRKKLRFWIIPHSQQVSAVRHDYTCHIAPNNHSTATCSDRPNFRPRAPASLRTWP